MTDPQCVTNRVAEFLDRGTTDGLDTSCVERMRREPFLIGRESFDALVREWVDWIG